MRLTRKFWGFVSNSENGKVQQPIVTVSFGSKSLRDQCQAFVDRNFPQQFVGQSYASDVSGKRNATHFLNLEEFRIYMKRWADTKDSHK